jgi:N-acetylneuraminate synthase
VTRLPIGRRWIGDGEPTYFVADISANHDGDLDRAKLLIRLAKDAGADAAKFQNFRAPQIVSRQGFEALGAQLAHQASWKKSVYQVYEAASLPWEWTKVLKEECDRVGIDYFSAPYDLAAVDMLDPFVEVYKIGSGDITWPEMLEHVARKGKPVMLATGASSIGDVQRAVEAIVALNPRLVLMQCNTNYTGDPGNFRHIHLNVLKTYRAMFPSVLLGLSDHTPGHATVLGAVALGARVIEKHFTDDTRREGPDHAFSMDPGTWMEMVARTRELEAALGGGSKAIEENERASAVVQRRCLRAARDLAPATALTRQMIDVLRPAPEDAIPPFELPRVVGRRTRVGLRAGEHLTWSKLE